MKLPLFVAALFLVSRAAPPVVTVSGWRHAQFNVGTQPISLTAIQLTFDQELYINMGGNQMRLADFRAAVGEWPAVAYRLQGSLAVRCGGVSANQYDYPNSVPGYILNVPPTDDPIATFFGYFAGFFLKAQKSYNTWPFMILHTVSGISKMQLDQCLASGTLQIELFPTPCRPSNATVNMINQNYRNSISNAYPPGYDLSGIVVYKKSDLLCAVTNHAGEAIANTVYTNLPRVPLSPDCTLAGVQQLKDDVAQLRQQLPLVRSKEDLNGIDFAELAITLRLTYQGCLDRLNKILRFKKRTRNVGTSRDCPDRTNKTSRAFLANPCCNYREGRCCVAQPVTQTFEFPFAINRTALNQLCAGGSTDPLIGRLLRVFTVARNLELRVSAKEDMSKLFDQLFWNVWNECQGSMFSQRCTANSQCYSRNCEVRGGRCRQNPRGQALPMIRCLIEKYESGDGKLSGAFQDFANIQVSSAGDIEAIAQGIYSYLKALHPTATDCVGQSSDAFRSRLENVRNTSSGLWIQRIKPADAAGCTAKKQCNWDPYRGFDAQQCLSRGGTNSFCGICQPGGACQDITRAPVCTFSWSVSYNFMLTQQECSMIGGTYGYTDRWANQQTCLKLPLNATGDYTTCLNTAICPGPNSPDPWIKQTFRNTKWDNHVCNNQICYNTAITTAQQCYQLASQLRQEQMICITLAGGDPAKVAACAGNYVYWDRNYQNGAGLCTRALDWPTRNLPSFNKQICAAMNTSAVGTWMYYPGVIYRTGEFYTQSLCTNAKVCELPNQQPFTVQTNAECTSQNACDRSCPDCVQTVAAEGTLFCSVNLNETTCANTKSGNPRFDTPSQTCLLEVVDAANCTSMGGSMVSCRGKSRAMCGNSALPYQSALSCQYRDWAPCLTPADCLNQGTCDDYDLSNWDKCQTAGGCPICVYPFPKDADGKAIIRCGVPIVNGYPCERCGIQSTQQNYRWSRYGCILQDQSRTTNRSTCEASTAPYDSNLNGMWLRTAKTRAECETRAQGCVRYGGWFTRVAPAECRGCGGRNTSLYQWTAGRLRPGHILSLQWRQRRFESENSVINTLPVSLLQQSLEEVVARFLATLVINRVAASYDLRFNVYSAIIERCNNRNANVGSVRGIIGVCRCYGGGKPCQGTCPVECPGRCRYNTLAFIAAIGNLLGRRRLQVNVGSSNQAVYDGTGAQVGVYVGDAWQLNGTLAGTTVRLCVPDNVQYTVNISSEYVIPDFAPTLAGSGLPGIPMSLPAVREGTSTCANVTLGDFGLYPILRLNTSFAKTTMAPPTTTSTSSTPMSTGATNAPPPVTTNAPPMTTGLTNMPPMTTGTQGATQAVTQAVSQAPTQDVTQIFPISGCIPMAKIVWAVALSMFVTFGCSI